MVSTRTVVQIRTHAQKYFQKINKGRSKDDRILSTAEGSVDSAFKRRIIGKGRSKKRKAVAPGVLGAPVTFYDSPGGNTEDGHDDSPMAGSRSDRHGDVRDKKAGVGGVPMNMLIGTDTPGRSPTSVVASSNPTPATGLPPSSTVGGLYSVAGPAGAKRTRSSNGLMFMDLDAYEGVGGNDPYNVYSGYDAVCGSDAWTMGAAAYEVSEVATPLQELRPSLAASKATTGGLRKQRANESLGEASLTSVEDYSGSDDSSTEHGLGVGHGSDAGGAMDIRAAPLSNVSEAPVPMAALTPAIEREGSLKIFTATETDAVDQLFLTSMKGMTQEPRSPVSEEEEEVKAMPFDDDLLVTGLLEIFP